MDQNFWLDKWANNQIGFHELTTHSLLRDWWPKLELDWETKVLVPLCGKSLDMIWLMERHSLVIGIEISEIAVKTFFKENNLNFTTTQFENYSRFSAEGVLIYCGDIFNIPLPQIAICDCIYDRAALIALSPLDRKHYESLLLTMTKRAGKMLLITVDYDIELISPPPYVIPKEEVEEIYASHWTLTRLVTQPTDVKGITGKEVCYKLEKK